MYLNINIYSRGSQCYLRRALAFQYSMMVAVSLFVELWHDSETLGLS